MRVSIRVFVDQRGAVIDSRVDHGGPSRYFERLALEASKKWSFPPAQSEPREYLLRFNFTRSGATAHSNPLPSKS